MHLTDNDLDRRIRASELLLVRRASDVPHEATLNWKRAIMGPLGDDSKVLIDRGVVILRGILIDDGAQHSVITNGRNERLRACYEGRRGYHETRTT